MEKINPLLTKHETVAQFSQYCKDGIFLGQLHDVFVGFSLTSFGGVSAYIDKLNKNPELKPVYGSGLGVALCNDLSGYERPDPAFDRLSDSKTLLELELRRFLRESKNYGILNDPTTQIDFNEFSLRSPSFSGLYESCRYFADADYNRLNELLEMLDQKFLGSPQYNLAAMYRSLIHESAVNIGIDLESELALPLLKEIREGIDFVISQ